MSLAVFRARLAMAEFAIRQLHARYADACWRKDADAMRALFAADGVWDFSSGPQRGGDAIARFLGGGFGHYRHICVTMGTPIVSLSGERAAARTYLVEQGLLADGAPYRTVGIMPNASSRKARAGCLHGDSSSRGIPAPPTCAAALPISPIPARLPELAFSAGPRQDGQQPPFARETITPRQ